ncbi:MAG: Metastasis-associated protein mta1, partial [Paramarteilia canceri]
TDENSVEARCSVIYRRKDLPPAFHQVADESFYKRIIETLPKNKNPTLHEKWIAQNKELFISAESEQIPMEKARGICMAFALSIAETVFDHLEDPNIFHYFHTIDKDLKILSTDLKLPRIGNIYQATNIPKCTSKSSRDYLSINEKIWSANAVKIISELENYLVLVRSVGVLARSSDALTRSKGTSLSTIRCDSLRDTTIQVALNKLHENNYNFWKALQFWVDKVRPVMVTDQHELWIPNEIKRFEDSLDGIGKNFSEIMRRFLRWKSTKNIVEFYYLWKTTGRYLQIRILKSEDESKLKGREIKILKVKKSIEKHSMKYEIGGDQKKDLECESCKKVQNSENYYYINSPNPMIACESCWIFWKKVGISMIPISSTIE